ncbi:MAG TPA: hypothetical protein VEJ86_11000 [Candidatus Binataceae bacterium]|nr:hypothetical protein [Candidatus Binataceae bacterium]
MSSLFLPVDTPAWWNLSSGQSDQDDTSDTFLQVSESPMPVGCTFDNLQIWVSGNSGVTDSLTFTLLQNENPTALTCTIAALDPVNPTTCSDTTDTVTVSPGDLLAMQAVDNSSDSFPVVGVGSGLHCH